MKAAFLVGPQRLELREVPDPRAPEDGLVLEVRACGVCGSDLRRWREGPPTGEEVVPGHEIGGVVLEVGRNVRGYKPGDRLAVAPDIHCGHCYYCRRDLYNLCDNIRMVGITPGLHGGLAEAMVLTGEVLERGIVHRLPEGLSFAEGALAEPCSSVLAAHEKASTSVKDTVAILGAGPIGCIHICVAKARGARVIVSQRSEPRRRLAARFGPDVIIDPVQEHLISRVRELTEGRGADIVVCANSSAASQADAVQIVRKGGRVILFGGLPKADPMATFDANRIHYGEIQVVGAFSYHPVFHELALEVLARKLVPAELLITHTLPLTEVERAFQIASSGEALKVIVSPRP